MPTRSVTRWVANSLSLAATAARVTLVLIVRHPAVVKFSATAPFKAAYAWADGCTTKVQRVALAHDRKIGGRNRARLIINGPANAVPPLGV